MLTGSTRAVWEPPLGAGKGGHVASQGHHLDTLTTCHSAPQVPGTCRTYFLDLRPKEVGGEERATKPRIESLKDAGLPLICLALLSWSLFLHFTNNVKYQLKIAMHAFHLSFIALTDSIRLQKRTFFFLVLAYSDDL